MAKLRQVQNFARLGLKYQPLAQIVQLPEVEQLAYKITNTPSDVVVDLLRTMTWHTPNQPDGVVTDKILQRYFLPADFRYFDVTKANLAAYLANIFAIQSRLRVNPLRPAHFNFDAIADLATAVNTLQISLPDSRAAQQAAPQTTNAPVLVLVNGQDYSSVFQHARAAGHDIVNQVFTSIMRNQDLTQQVVAAPGLAR